MTSNNDCKLDESDLQERGHAVLELALALPILCIVAFASLEISRSIKHAQFSAVMSREVASLGYRECIIDINNRQIEDCLGDRRERIHQFASLLFPGTEILVSVYQCEPNASFSGCTSLTRRAIVGANTAFESRFAVDGTSLTGDIPDEFLAKQGNLILAESYVPFSSVIPGIGSLFTYAPEGFYDATIM